MLIEKEVIRPGTYFYRDESTGLPRKLVVTPELTKYWHDQGNAMLGGDQPLTVPVPCEHDFEAHPMTPADKLKNNAGWVKEYRMKGDRLFAVTDITDPDIGKKLPHTIRWTSPWINSFTDGNGKEWRNVISHLALTTRPRIAKQEPFGSVAAALSIATEVRPAGTEMQVPKEGLCLSLAGRLFTGKKTGRLRPRYPVAFSLWGGGIKLSDDDMPPPKKKDKKKDGGSEPPEDEFGGDLPDEEKSSTPPPDGTSPSVDGGDDGIGGLANPLMDSGGDVKMEELLCDLLQALGVPMPDMSNEGEFKRHLYEAVMSKIKELTSKGMSSPDQGLPDQNQPPTQQPNASQPNPLIQQEQQPMFMSLDEINKIADPTMKTVALSMYNENARIRKEAEEDRKRLSALNAAKLAEEAAKRATRVAWLGRISPKVKADLDAMLALPAMALSLGDGGVVVDPMAQTLAMLEKGLADMPRLLTTDQSALSVVPQPTDASMMSDQRAEELADSMARQMGCAPKKQAS